MSLIVGGLMILAGLASFFLALIEGMSSTPGNTGLLGGVALIVVGIVLMVWG